MLDLTFDPDGLIPVITQAISTKEVLMLAWADSAALELTLQTGYAHYFSRSRKKIWKKGEESGHLQRVHEICTDCDTDALLYLVTQIKAACHTGYRSCFYRTVQGKLIGERLFDPAEVYTNSNE